MNGNYIKINRSILDWEWYEDINTTRLFIHMILKANWKDGRFKGTTVPRGSFVSSIRRLSEETALTEREIRTAIAHLKSTGEVTSNGHSKYSVFTVVNYDSYQPNDTQNDNQETVKRHSNDILTTTIEERKEGKKGNNILSFPPSDFDFDCVNRLIESCKKTVPNAKVPKSQEDITEWAVEIERMRRLDGHTEAEIKKVLNFAITDPFWKTNIRSTKKLRKQYDTLYAQSNMRGTKKQMDNNNFARRAYDMDNLEKKLLGG